MSFPSLSRHTKPVLTLSHRIISTNNILLKMSVSLQNTFSSSIRMGDDSEDNSDKTSSLQKKDHLQLTSHQQREPGIHTVTVSEIKDISPTVKKVLLTTAVKPVPIQFKAGQWIDMFIPNVSTVGGFSMTSSPLHLQKTGQLELAIKYSTWPPSFWIHTQCKVGSEVSIRTGGDFFFDSAAIGKTDRVLLLAGGVGINPLASMIKEIEDEKKDKDSSRNEIRISLLFSAKLESELLFKERFESLAETDKDFKCSFFVTGDQAAIPRPSHSTTTTTTTQIKTKAGRIGLVEIRKALEEDLRVSQVEDRERLHVYICGPPPMIQDMAEGLRTLKITKNMSNVVRQMGTGHHRTALTDRVSVE